MERIKKPQPIQGLDGLRELNAIFRAKMYAIDACVRLMETQLARKTIKMYSDQTTENLKQS